MSYPFDFPVEPYSIQISFMNSLMEALSHKKLGILESPTGTGKTLSIICASFTWYKANINSSLPQIPVEDADTVSLHPIMRNEQRLRKTAEDQSFYSLRTQDNMISYEEEDEAYLKLKRQERTWQRSSPQIIYVSRTHTQLNQFISEVRRTKWAQEPDKMTIVRLGSRKQLCINEFLDDLRGTPILNYRCKELIDPDNFEEDCHLFKNQNKVSEHLLKHICDIEDLVTAGKKSRGCPYYATRSSIESAEVIAAPYSSVLNRGQRDAIGLSLEDSVLIVDEAHNLIDAIIDAYSCSISYKHIAHGLFSLQAYFHKFSPQLTPRTVLFLRRALNVLRSLYTFVETHSTNERSFSIKVSDFLTQNSLESEGFRAILDFIEEVELVRKVGKFGANLPEKYDASSMHYFVELLQCLSADTDQGKFIFDYDAEKKTASLRYLLLDVAKAFNEILNEARCVILAGGTLEPFDEFNALVETLPKDKILKFQCSHVISDDNLLLTTIGESENGSTLRFTYDNRDNENMMYGLAEILIGVVKSVPHGVVVFLPSYAFLNKLKMFLVEKKILSEIESRKRAIFDNKYNDVLGEYSQLATHRGAILFAVVRGTLSEGINFSDRMGRCIILVGMPYPNKNHIDIIERMNFLDTHSDSFKGQIFYENLCHKAINQSIGRAIRHKDDFAVILLVDIRHEKNIQKRPRWMMKYAKKFYHVNQLRDFFRRKIPIN